jgi:hypothetical protein
MAWRFISFLASTKTRDPLPSPGDESVMAATANVPADCRFMPACFMDFGSFAQMQRRSRVTNISQLIDHIDSLSGRTGPRDAERFERALGPVVAAREKGETLCGYNASEIWAESSSSDKPFHCWSNDGGYSIGGLATKTKVTSSIGSCPLALLRGVLSSCAAKTSR